MSLNQNIKANQDEIKAPQEFTETNNKNSLEDNNSIENSYNSVIERINEKKEELKNYINNLNQNTIELKGEILFYFNKELKSITKNVDNYIDTNNVIQNILDTFKNKQKELLENSYNKNENISEIIAVDNG
jgi:hypothetical protein